MSLAFEWDDRKARANLAKHGVSFEEAITVFGDPLALTIPDDVHSIDKDRFITLGESDKRRLLVVVFTERRPRIRIIGARRPNLRERRQYHEKDR